MRVGDAAEVLGVSRATVHNWLKSGRLRLRSVSPAGYRDIDDDSVYGLAAEYASPADAENRAFVFLKDGTRVSASLPDAEAARLVEYLALGPWRKAGHVPSV